MACVSILHASLFGPLVSRILVSKRGKGRMRKRMTCMPLSVEEKVHLLSMVDVFESLPKEEL
jgi:hypothetical protein